jgi:acyl-CoA thioesterase
VNDTLRTPLPTILGSLQPSQNGSWTGHVTPDWMQGRTLYGGISAALCLQAARQQFDGLPPLRSAQFSFVGPAAGDVTLTPTMLRHGKSAAFVGVNLMSEAGHGTAAVICFGAPRQSTVNHNVLVMPDVSRPEECDNFFPQGAGPQFSRHFEVRLASGSGPFTAARAADLILWVRPLDADTQPLEALWLALADMPPPAAMSMMSVFAPISTMSWMVDVLTPGHQSPDGWFLIRTTARHVADGYSEQTMLMWASDGVPLVSGHQSVALFS